MDESGPETGESGPGLLASSKVYAALKQAIVAGELMPGEALGEAELSERLGVSRTPVREAVQRLARDGLVVSQRRRWVVRRHSVTEIEDIYQVRAALEAHAAYLAAVRGTAEEKAAILALAHRYEESDQLRGDERVHINASFHGRILEAAHSPRLAEDTDRNTILAFNRQVEAGYSPAELARSWAQHVRIAEAIHAGDAEAAAVAARDHVLMATKLLQGH